MMDINFLKMAERLKQSARELESMVSLDGDDDFVQFEFQLKFNEINKIVSILENMLKQQKEEDSLQVLNE